MEARDKSRIFETVQAIGGLEWMKKLGPDGQQTEEEVQVWETGVDCKDCLEDIVRFLRHDTPTKKLVRTQLAQWEVVQQHILPLFTWESENHEILFQAAKVLVMVSMPDIGEAENKAELLDSHQAYKEAFLKQNYLAVVANAATYPIQRLLEIGAEDERTSEATKFLELILCLLRNLLVVPDSNSPNGARARMQEEFIRQLKDERILDAFIVLCRNVQQEQNRPYAPLLLDIICAMVAHSRPQQISSARSNAAQTGTDEVLKSSLSSRLKASLQREKIAANAARNSAALQHLNRPMHLHIANKAAASSVGSQHLLTPALPKAIEASRRSKPTGDVAAGELAADVLLIIAEFADKLLREGAFNALVAVIASGLVSAKKSREEALAEQENRAQYYTAIGWFTEYASVLVSSPPLPTWLLASFEEVFDASLFAAIGKWIAEQIEARAWNLISPALSALKGLLLFAKSLFFSSPVGSEMRLVGKGFLMNAVHDPDHFLDLLVALQHRIGASKTTRRFGVLIIELIEHTMNLLEKWNDGPLFSLGRKRAAQSTEDNAEQPQNSEDEENEEDDQPRKEIAIDPVKYLRRFVSSDTISNYLFFLSSYASNPAWLDKMILDFFDRIAKEGLIRMFHEARTILFLRTVLADPSIRGNDEFKALLQFANDVMSDLRNLLTTNPFAYVELLFTRNQRYLYHLDGDVAPIRVVHAPSNPFEKETLITLFRSVDLDEADVLLLGDTTLEALVDMPDEEVKKLPFAEAKIEALIVKLAPLREWRQAEKEREAKRKEREERRREREEREKREAELRLERRARGDVSSEEEGQDGAIADEDSDQVRRRERAKAREIQKESSTKAAADGDLQLEDAQDLPGKRSRVIDDEDDLVDRDETLKRREGDSDDDERGHSRKKQKKKEKKAAATSDSEDERRKAKERERRKQKQLEKQQKEREIQKDKEAKEKQVEETKDKGAEDKSPKKKKKEKIHKLDPTEEKRATQQRKATALQDLLARRGINTSNNPFVPASASTGGAAAQQSTSIPDPTSHLSTPSLSTAPPTLDTPQSQAPPLPSAATTVSPRKRIRKSAAADEEDLDLLDDGADQPNAGQSRVKKASRQLLDDNDDEQ